MPTSSLWPKDFPQLSVKSPLAILREQGAALGEQTANVVLGRVETEASGDLFLQRFLLFCPPLAYQRELLRVTHGIELYPAQVFVAGDKAPSPITAQDPDSLSDVLRDIFGRESTKRIIASLLKQSGE